MNHKQDPKTGVWRQAIPEPFWTTEGLHWWQKFWEKNWRPQCYFCKDKPIFSNRDEFRKHYRNVHIETTKLEEEKDARD